MKIVTLGEIMLRLSTEGFKRFIQSEKFDINYGGAEANVALSLSNLGIMSEFITKLPENDIGQAGINFLRRYGVKTENVARGGKRTGIYFLEKGADARPSKVIYDREYSSFAEATVEDFDFEKIFEDTDWFHFTGIACAVNQNLCYYAVKKAKEKGIIVSCDINYRSMLWDKDKASQSIKKYMPYVDVCITNKEHAKTILLDDADLTTEQIFKELKEKYNFELIAMTFRETINSLNNNVSSILYDGKSLYKSSKYNVNIIDRVGAGDAFSAGLIYSLLNKMDLQKAIDFAEAACRLKHSIEGDVNIISEKEINEFKQNRFIR